MQLDIVFTKTSDANYEELLAIAKEEFDNVVYQQFGLVPEQVLAESNTVNGQLCFTFVF